MDSPLNFGSGMKKIIFEDENIVVVHKSGSSGYMLITFGDRVTLASGDHFSAERPVTVGDINCIGFMAKSSNWFPKKSILAALDEVSKITSQFEIIITYGGSMGGYAALKYSSTLGAATIISYIPQWSISPEDCGSNDSRFSSYFTVDLKNMAIEKSEINGKAYIFVDPHYKQDVFHYEKIKSIYPTAKKVNVYSADHHVTAILAGSSALKLIVESAMRDDEQRLLESVAETRRKNKFRIRIVLERATLRHPMMLLKMFEAVDKNDPAWSDPFFKDVGEKMLSAVSGVLSDVDFYLLASSFRWMNIEELKSIIFMPEPRQVLLTFHQTILVYDVLSESIRCLQRDELKRCHHCLPITLHGDYGVLDVSLAGKRYSLSFKRRVIVNKFPAQKNLGELITYRKIDDYYVISGGGFNLSSKPNGRASFSATHIMNWEMFRVALTE